MTERNSLILLVLVLNLTLYISTDFIFPLQFVFLYFIGFIIGIEVRNLYEMKRMILALELENERKLEKERRRKNKKEQSYVNF